MIAMLEFLCYLGIYLGLGRMALALIDDRERHLLRWILSAPEVKFIVAAYLFWPVLILFFVWRRYKA